MCPIYFLEARKSMKLTFSLYAVFDIIAQDSRLERVWDCAFISNVFGFFVVFLYAN